jgi:hypothetical protein
VHNFDSSLTSNLASAAASFPALDPTLQSLLRRPAWLERVNGIAVACGVAAGVALELKILISSGFRSVSIAHLRDPWDVNGRIALASAGAALVHALVGTLILRHPRMSALVRFTLCIPLASSACGNASQLSPVDSRHMVGADFLRGATEYVVFWGPLLVVALLIFGYPLHRAQRASSEGLRNQDVAEQVIGAIAAVVGIVSSIACMWLPLQWMSLVPATCAISATAFGAITATCAHRRVVQRDRWMASLRDGQLDQFAYVESGASPRVVQIGATALAYRSTRPELPLLEVLADGDVKPIAPVRTPQ